jgi:glycosyltransferase involved in cell wall biosynthesis
MSTGQPISKGLRILWYRMSPPVGPGGTERLLLEALRHFRVNGVQAKVLLHEPVEDDFARLMFADYLSNFEVLPGFSDDERAPATWFVRTARYFGRVTNFLKIIRRLEPDVIILDEEYESHHLWLYSLGGLFRLPPIVAFIHGSPFQDATDRTKYALSFRRHFKEFWGSDPVYRELIPANPPAMSLRERVRLEFDSAVLRAGVRMSRMVLVLSKKNRNEVERRYGIENVEVVSPGGYSRKDIELAGQRELPASAAGFNRPMLLSVCRLVSKKRVDLLIRAFGVFLDRNPGSKACLVVGGTGTEDSELRGLAASLGLSERVRFLGLVPEEELPGWYAACDLFLSADNADYDLSVMAALVESKMIVASTQYDVPFGLNRLRRYFHLAEANPESFARAMEQALAVAPVARDFVDFAELQSLTWESYFDRILDHARRASLRAAVTRSPLRSESISAAKP